jgi:hypothetical protein
MTYENNNKFQQWLLDNHERTVDDLSWEEYNKYHVMYSNQTFFERMIKLNKELV